MATTIDNPFSAPPGSYPPATVRWKYFSTTAPAGQDIWVVPFQPGTPLGVLVPTVWQVSDIFFRVENVGSSNSTLQIQRSTGTGGFSSVNNINDTPVVILAGNHEALLRPLVGSVINKPLVNSGDKLTPAIVVGTGAGIISIYVTLTQMPGV
jgi:hypothetical protein